MFPKIEAGLNEINALLNESEEIKPLGKDFKFNYKTGQHEIVDGRIIETSSDETITQWIEKVLRTVTNKYKIYKIDDDDSFGISMYEMILDKSIPFGFITSELKREITEQIKSHRYIKNADNFKFERDKRTLNIYFDVELITEKTLEMKVDI